MNESPGTAGHGRSIWMRPERAARGPAPEHSRAEIALAGVTLADAEGLAAVTMRSVAAATGAAAASLYRYVSTRDELIELMADQVYGEYVFDAPLTGQPVADLIALARQGFEIYLRHPWLIDVRPSAGYPGPNALAFVERALAALETSELSGTARLETIGLFSGAVRLIAQTELDQRSAGQDPSGWQDSLAGYLLGIAADGHHPRLAAALADTGTAVPGPLFDRAMPPIVAGLLQPR